jgi:cytosine/adenosine deaminase-related metal-dependent hydrolase
MLGDLAAASVLGPREAWAMATTGGAAAIGLGDRLGTLEPGKQADVLLLRADAPNLAPVSDPVGAVALAAGPHNVDAVLVAGQWVKRDGRFVHRDLGAVVARAAESNRFLLDTAGVRGESWCPPVIPR